MNGIVLAGGENRRMGTDKAFLKIAGTYMIDHVLQALRRAVNRIIIVTNSPEAYARYGVTVVADVYDKRGPLTGIYSGLLQSDDEYNFVAACDMPFLNPGLISYMAGLTGEYDVVLPRIGEFVEPLHAVYRRAVMTVIDSQIRSEQRQIQRALEGLRLRYVTENEVDRFDPKRRSFINLNTPEEYEEATCSDLECRN